LADNETQPHASQPLEVFYQLRPSTNAKGYRPPGPILVAKPLAFAACCQPGYGAFRLIEWCSVKTRPIQSATDRARLRAGFGAVVLVRVATESPVAGRDPHPDELAVSRPRYGEAWLEPFYLRLALFAGVTILDVGAGRRPSVPKELRPARCHYVALDPSPQELAASPQGSYDEVVIGDVTDALPALAGRFDLVVSWQVLEHVRPMEKAVANLRTFLRPGGHLVAQVSGRYSAFAILNMASPHQVSTRAMQRLLGRAPETVFRAHYDHCTYSSLQRLLSQWRQVEIVPRYRGAGYFAFSRILQRAYLVYEDWVEAKQHRNLATHFLISAAK